MLRMGLASTEEIDRLWPLIQAGIQKSCERGTGEYCAGDFWQMCRSGNAFLILGYTDNDILMASVWRFESHEHRHSFHCLTLYGAGMRHWLNQARHYIEKLAKDNGATRLTACGRSGWVRVFGAAKRGDLYEVEI
jgi:hypothetical protein